MFFFKSLDTINNKTVMIIGPDQEDMIAMNIGRIIKTIAATGMTIAIQPITMR